MEFDHIGIPAPAKREGMRYLEPKRLWLTSPADHPFRVDWLWYEPDGPEHELVRSVSHVEGHPVIVEPFDVFGEVRVSFIEVDCAPVEFVQPYE